MFNRESGVGLVGEDDKVVILTRSLPVTSLSSVSKMLKFPSRCGSDSSSHPIITRPPQPTPVALSVPTAGYPLSVANAILCQYTIRNCPSSELEVGFQPSDTSPPGGLTLPLAQAYLQRNRMAGGEHFSLNGSTRHKCNHGARDNYFMLVSYRINGSFVDTDVAIYLFRNPQRRPFCSARSLSIGRSRSLPIKLVLSGTMVSGLCIPLWPHYRLRQQVPLLRFLHRRARRRRCGTGRTVY